MPNISMFKLDARADGKGLCCDRAGLFFAGEPLLERDQEGVFRPRSPAVLRKILARSSCADADTESHLRTLNVVATALNKGEVAKAMIAAVLMRLPEPQSVPPTDLDDGLAKAGFNSDESRDEHGRWTRDGGAILPAKRTEQAFLEPFVEPLIEPMIEPSVGPKQLPFGIDILPPIMGPRRIRPTPPTPRHIRNPYPHRPECEKE